MTLLGGPREERIERLADLLDQVAAFATRFVAFGTDAQRDGVTLWIAHTHAFAAAETTPRLSIQSAEKQSGKTRLLEVLELLVADPRQVVNVSEAALFRSIDKGPPTILFDEVDAIFGPKARDREDLRAMLNAGYRRGATIDRCVGEHAKLEVKAFKVFAPVAFAGIGSLPDTIEDRAAVIRLRRRRPDEQVEKLRRRDVEPEADALRAELADVLGAATPILSEMRPELPDALSDRAADCWEPLAAIADLAGSTWPARARHAALGLAPDADDSPTIGVAILAGCRVVFAQRDRTRVPTLELLAELNDDDTAPWAGWNDGDGITARDLARRLGPFGIKPKKVRDGGAPFRGYATADFTDAFARYLTPQAEQPEHLEQLNGGADVPDAQRPTVDRYTEHLNGGADVPDVPLVPPLSEEGQQVIAQLERDLGATVTDEELFQ